MDLKTNEATGWNCLILLGVVCCQDAVQPESDVAVFAANDVVVPIVGFNDTFGDRRMRVRQRFVSARLVVKAAPISFAHVGLIARHFKSWLLQPLAAELNSAIDESSAG